RGPRQAPLIEPRPAEATRASAPSSSLSARRFRSPHTLYPHAHFLSNGAYTAIVTNAGGGHSSCRGRVVTRAREDRTRDVGSQFVYLRDVRTGLVWSAAYQPTCHEAEEYLVTFMPERAVFRPPAAGGGGTEPFCRARAEHGRAHAGARGVGERPRPVPRPRTLDGGPDRPRRPRAVRHRRRGAGSGRQLAPARTPAPRRLRTHVVRNRGRVRPRGGAGAGPEVPRPRLRSEEHTSELQSRVD